ncbi:hypothetical protein QBC43DRAFT_299456 [Cladorrhinum sp. PSN259]|nr:hypothetical protein QBC43DRAFT_299456 [Cladorrhinum sp. PSN259]
MKPSTLLASLTAAATISSAQFLTSTRLTGDENPLEPRNQNDLDALNQAHHGKDFEPRNGQETFNTLGVRQEVETIFEAKTVTEKGPGGGGTKRPTPTAATNSSPAKQTTSAKDEKSSSSSQITSSVSSSATSTSESTTPSAEPSELKPTDAASSKDDDKDEDNKGGGGISAGTAAGIAAGAVAGLALIGLILFLVYRRRKGPIRGAVVTADYPDDMGMVEKDPSLRQQGSDSGMNDIDGYGAEGRGSGGQDSLPKMPTEAADEEEYMDVPAGVMGKEVGSGMPMDGYGYEQQQQQQQFASEGRGYGYESPPPQQMPPVIPPAGMMPAAAAVMMRNEYSSPPPQQPFSQQQFAPQPGGQTYSSQQQQSYTHPPQRTLTTQDLPVGMAMSSGEYHSYKPQPVSPLVETPRHYQPQGGGRRRSSARPVSAYLQRGSYPSSPGGMGNHHPILPVSPLSTYYPDRQSSQGPPLAEHIPASQQQHISAYYPGAGTQPNPGTTMAPAEASLLPQFMIPGGGGWDGRSRAMSYSGAHTNTGGGGGIGMVDGGGNAAPPVPVQSRQVTHPDHGRPGEEVEEEEEEEQPLSPLRRNPFEPL